MPSLHTHSLTPPLLLTNSSGTITEQVLDQALLEGEVRKKEEVEEEEDWEGEEEEEDEEEEEEEEERTLFVCV